MRRRRSLLMGFMSTFLMSGVVAAAPLCTTFEAEVFSVDASGKVHRLFNFAQALKNGTDWKSSSPLTSEAVPGATLDVSVQWEREVDLTPIVDLQIHVPATGQRAANDGSARLEKLVWDSLVGPEQFTTADGKPLALGAAGYAVAVLAISTEPCAKEPKP